MPAALDRIDKMNRILLRLLIQHSLFYIHHSSEAPSSLFKRSASFTVLGLTWRRLKTNQLVN